MIDHQSSSTTVQKEWTPQSNSDEKGLWKGNCAGIGFYVGTTDNYLKEPYCNSRKTLRKENLGRSWIEVE